MPTIARCAPSTTTRRGFTLVEVLVAVVVLLGGLVTIATATAAALRMLGDARMEEESAILAARRLETLRALPCAARTDGERIAGPLVERWWVAPHANGAATRLVVTVAPVASARGTRATATRRYETVAPC